MLSSSLCDSNLTRPICYPPESQSYRSTKTRLYVTSSSKHGGHYCVANDKCYNILLKCSLLVQRVLLASSPHEPFWMKDQEICWGKRSILHVNTGLKQLELLWSRCSLFPYLFTSSCFISPNHTASWGKGWGRDMGGVGGGSRREEEEVCFFICFCTTSIWVANVSTD